MDEGEQEVLIVGRGLIAVHLSLGFLVARILTGCGVSAEGTVEWYLQQGSNFIEQGRYDEAIEQYTRAIELNPNLPHAYNNRAYVYLIKRQYDLAIAECNRAIELDSSFAMAYINRALAYKGQGKKEEALADLEKSVTLTKDPQLIGMARHYIEELSK